MQPLSMIVDFLNKADERKTAEALLDTFAKYASSLEQYDELAKLYNDLTLYSKSKEQLELCLGACSAHEAYGVRSNLAKVLNKMNLPQEAIRLTNLNLAINSDDHSVKLEQAFSYYLMGDLNKSKEMQSSLLEIPNLPDAVKKQINFNFGTFDMSEGKFKSGLRKMIIGGKKDIGIWKTPTFPFPTWDGSKTDKTIVVYAESGIGDEIMNVRFMKHISYKGMNAVWFGTRKDTNDLFRFSGFDVVESIYDLDPRKEYLAIDSTSLPVILDLDESEVNIGEYLKVDKERVKYWKDKLPEQFITVRWSGNPLYDHDLHRSVDKELLINTLKGFGLPLVSLQIDAGKDQGNLIVPDVNDWRDTIAIQHLATMNVTSCTSTAHSAAASGANVIVLPPICTYYPWLNLVDNKSHWYNDNVTVYPQTVHKDWSGPVEQLKQHLIKSGLKYVAEHELQTR